MMRRLWNFDSRYAATVESYLGLAFAQIGKDQARLADGRPSKMPPSLFDARAAGRTTVSMLPDALIDVGSDLAQRNARIVALVCDPDFEMYTSAHGKTVISVGKHDVEGDTAAACFDALLALQDGMVTSQDLDAREAGDHLHAMGGSR
jgi:hypothetical protein